MSQISSTARDVPRSTCTHFTAFADDMMAL